MGKTEAAASTDFGEVTEATENDSSERFRTESAEEAGTPAGKFSAVSTEETEVGREGSAEISAEETEEAPTFSETGSETGAAEDFFLKIFAARVRRLYFFLKSLSPGA